MGVGSVIWLYLGLHGLTCGLKGTSLGFNPLVSMVCTPNGQEGLDPRPTWRGGEGVRVPNPPDTRGPKSVFGSVSGYMGRIAVLKAII